jgi:transposase
MGRLDDITLQDLQNQLEQTNGKVPTKRVLAAIARKQGDTIATLADRHNVCKKTIRNWLDRFAEQPIDQAPYDEDRSGRPPALTDKEYDAFIADLHTSPTEFGYDRQAWFPALAHDHLTKTYGVEYSLRHIRRLMKEAGLSWRTARPRHYEADPEEEAEYRETVQKKS